MFIVGSAYIVENTFLEIFLIVLNIFLQKVEKLDHFKYMLIMNITDEFETVFTYNISNEFNFSSEFNTNSSENLSDTLEDLTSTQWSQVIMYTLLFFLGGPANLYRFVTLMSTRSRATRFHKVLLHLVSGDMVVTWVMIPTEIFWQITNMW